MAESACSRPLIFSRGQSPRVVSSLPSSTARGLVWAAHRLEDRREASTARESRTTPSPRIVPDDFIIESVPASFTGALRPHIAVLPTLKGARRRIEYLATRPESKIANRQSTILLPLPMAYHRERQGQVTALPVSLHLQIPVARVILGDGRKVAAAHLRAHQESGMGRAGSLRAQLHQVFEWTASCPGPCRRRRAPERRRRE